MERNHHADPLSMITSTLARCPPKKIVMFSLALMSLSDRNVQATFQHPSFFCGPNLTQLCPSSFSILKVLLLYDWYIESRCEVCP